MAALSDVLVVNAGSTSLKLSIVDDAEHSRSISSFEDAPRVQAVAHRIVHGGERFVDPVVVDDDVVDALHALVDLAPLHMTPALRALDSARRAIPDARHVAVFDTAFHRTLPLYASTYALPARWRDLGIRRFGFHGLSVSWAAERVEARRLVVCHLGGGCSVTAVHDGRSVDTTMGFTPLDGVPMGSRPGSIDPGVPLYLLRHGVTVDELSDGLEHESGLTGLAGTGDVEQLLRDDSEQVRLALDVFTYRVAQAVSAMATALGGLDAIAFTGGIGENATPIRDGVVQRLEFLQPFEVHVVPAREDVVAARAARRCVGSAAAAT